MKLFGGVPTSVKVASLALAASPWFVCIVGFRLYAHPANPDAWFILAVLAPIYTFGAFLFLKRFGFARWIWAFLVTLSVVSSVPRLAGIWRDLSTTMLLVAVVGLATHVSIAVLLFLPSANAFFREAKNA